MMQRLLFAFLCVGIHVPDAWSSDACSPTAIVAQADVVVSDDSSFRIESYFHTKHAAAIRHIDDIDQIVVVEGPVSWGRVDDVSQLGSDFHRNFALGHQYHAFLLYFDEIVANVNASDLIEFQGEQRAGKSGDLPYGGVVRLIQGIDSPRAAGLVFELPETDPIVVSFSNWGDAGGSELPFHVRIDDGIRTFDYRYTRIEVMARHPLWFFEALDEPALDLVQVYRLHRKLLAAHCSGNADMLADLSGAEIVLADRGGLVRVTNDALRRNFAEVFDRLDYEEYHDVELPLIDVSAAGDQGWVAASVRPIAAVKGGGKSFDNRWAWIMLVEKVGDTWLHVGNSASYAE